MAAGTPQAQRRHWREKPPSQWRAKYGSTGPLIPESNPAAVNRAGAVSEPPLSAGSQAQPSAGQVDLKARADQVHSVLPEFTQTKTTTAVGQVRNSDGSTEILVGSSEVRLRPAQRVALLPSETPVEGPGHAEVTIIEAAKRNGQAVESIAASRPICPECATAIDEAGAVPASSLKQGPGPK